MTDTYIRESRKGWYNGSRKQPTNDELKLGCLQRIADATESMAKEYNRLIRERDDLKVLYRSARDRADRAERKLSATRGVVTRLKNQRGVK